MFSVSFNAAGCLPDSDSYPLEFDTANEAWNYVAQEVEMIEDDADYLPAHTALHLQDFNSAGSIPGDRHGNYRYSVDFSN